MRTFALLAVAAVAFGALAGCTGTPAATTSSTTPPPAGPTVPAALPGTAYHFANGLALPAGTPIVGNGTAFVAAGTYNGITAVTFEPSLGVNPKTGSLFMTSIRSEGPLGAVQNTHILKGTDSGRNWTDVTPMLLPTGFSTVPNSNDPYLYVDPWTGRIFDFDMCGTLSAFCTYVSDDDGATWLLQSFATGEQTALDHQSIAAAPAKEGTPTVQYPNVLVFCVNRGGTTVGSWCSRSLDGGINWGPLLPGFPVQSTQCSGLSGHVKGAADGTFYRGNPSCSGPAVYRSDDAGLTWSEHTITNQNGTLGHDVEVAVDAANNLYAFWVSEKGMPFLAVSHDRGDTWTKPMMVAAPGVTAAGFPTVYAGAEGRVAFAYIGTTVAKGYGGKESDMTWNGYIGFTTDATSASPLFTTVTVNDAATDPLSKGQCGDIRCGGFGDFIDMTIQPSGRPFVAFANNEHGQAGIVGTLADGPALLGELAPLAHLDLPGPASLE